MAAGAALSCPLQYIICAYISQYRNCEQNVKSVITFYTELAVRFNLLDVLSYIE